MEWICDNCQREGMRMGKLTIHKIELSGAAVIETEPFEDERGSFNRLFCSEELSELLGDRQIVAVNQSRSVNVGTVRGMHYQRSPFMEVKMVRCLRGKVFDVMVDLRKESPTFLQWYSEVLTPDNHKMMFIPEGFGHGFQVLERESELLYLHTAPYNGTSEDGVRFDDPVIGIEWPLGVTDISERDRSHSLINPNTFIP